MEKLPALDELNATLSAAYERRLSAWPTISAQAKLSKPQLMMIPQSYLASKIKLMIVGQETAGWGDEQCDPSTPAGIAELMRGYSEWDLALHTRYRGTPFWQAAYSVQRALNPGGAENGFLWSNVVPVSQKLADDKPMFGRPTPEVSRTTASWGLLRTEVDVAQPDVIVFFTGPSRDNLLRVVFPEISFNVLTPEICEVRNLPRSTIAFRTYHPRYLRLRKRWSVLGEITDLALSAVNGGTS